MTRKLTGRGLAYEKLRSVYFDVARDKAYGRLCGTDLSKLAPGKTVDLDAYAKDSPLDFTLLKRVSLKDLKAGDALATPWGNVRPSWFLQMAAAATLALPSVTVVLTDEDKSFPHLENLRAIWASGAGLAPAAWLVGGRVSEREGHEGETPQLDALLALGVHPLTVRAWLLSTSYRKPLLASPAVLRMWERNRLKVQELAANLWLAPREEGRGSPEVDARCRNLAESLETAVADDLSVAHFWPELFSFCRFGNGLVAAGRLSPADAERLAVTLADADALLGLLDRSGLPLPRRQWPSEVAGLVAERHKARVARDFPRADVLRAEIATQGFRVEDSIDGARLYPAP